MRVSNKLRSILFRDSEGGSTGQADPTLMHGAFWGLTINATGLLLGLVTQKILANTLGPKGFGLYLYVLGWSNVAGLLCALEFSNAAVRYVSAYTATGDWASLRGFLRRSQQIVGGTTLTVSLLAVIVIATTNRLDHETEFCFLAACAVFPLTSIVQLHAACLLGWKRVRQSQAPFGVIRPALFAIGLLTMAKWLGSSFDAADAVAVQFFATGIALFITAWYLRRAMPDAALKATPVYHTMEWIKTSSHFVAISISQLVLSTQADLLFVGTILGKAEVGLYGAASQLATLVGFGSTAIMLIAQPMIADLYARGKIDALIKLSRQIVMLALVASIPVFVGVLLLGRWLLALIYGPDFEPAFPVLIVLAIAQLIAAVVGMLLGYLFTMTSHQQIATKIIGATAVLNIILALVLTYSMGMIGTATATAISTLARSVALFIAARRVLREAPTAS
ncbi:MAG: oligosaccharide flippase family protein [Gemmatimonadaceae bacterium]